MKRKPGLILFDPVKPESSQRVYLNVENSGRTHQMLLQKIDHTTTVSVAKTQLVIEAWHGVLYGAGIGLLIGAYILFFPLWITVSPAWYISTPWYVIITITTLTSMLLLGLGAATLGAHILKRANQPFPVT